MRSRPSLLLIILACAVLVTAAARAQETRRNSNTSGPSDATFQAIVSCLSQGREAVMVPQFHCEAYGVGAGFAQSDKMPLGLPDADRNEVCRNKDDPRHLPGDLIKRIAARKDAIAPSGKPSLELIHEAVSGGHEDQAQQRRRHEPAWRGQ